VDSVPRIPSVSELLWPTLRAVREIGDSGTNEEIVEKAIELEGFTEEQQEVLHGDGPLTKLEYRLAWARSHLKSLGALNNSERGVWSTTEAGRTMTREDVARRHAAYLASLRAARKARHLARAEQDEELDEDQSNRRDWRERLLEVLIEMPPDGFERLAQRLLREAGFVSATVTGKDRRRRNRRNRGLPPVARELSGLLSVQALQGQRGCRRREGLPWRDERSRRQGAADHDGLVHWRCQARGDARWRAAHRPHRRRAAMRSAQGAQMGVDIRLVEEMEISPEFFSEL
jgi:hypothetical protein